MNAELKIDFRLQIGEDQVKIEEPLKNPAELLNYYLSDEPWSDSTFRGGFCIMTGADRWNGKKEFNFDLFRYTFNWLTGMEKLLSGKSTIAEVGYWEESGATATVVKENELEIVDFWVTKDRIVSPPLRVNFEDFIRQLVREGKKYALLCALVNEEIKTGGELIEKALGQRIMDQMCGEDFKLCCSRLELLIQQRFDK